MANFLDIIKGEGLAVQLIRSLIDQDIPGSLILKQVRDAGLGIRTQTGYQVINYLRDVVTPSRAYISYLGLNNLPNVNRLPQSLTKQLRNFAYNVQLRGFNNIDGQLTTKNVTISSNLLLTKQEAIDAAVNMAAGDSKSGGVTGSSGKVVSVFQNSAGLVMPSQF
ncbi:MAG: hypothetical protein RB191_24930 [Terriglobia bacterium]|nr:hypothetical protein [Terriglobia bacterium]